ncbi:MAG: PLDc N-terminal domain-containing protein [archaeon]|jgi:predicted Co/Zn/Cd cation transporter (cation efflux family)
MAGIFSSGFGALGSVVGILALICAIWVIYDVLTNNKGLSDGAKAIWIICAILFSIITAVVYLLVYKMKK